MIVEKPCHPCSSRQSKPCSTGVATNSPHRPFCRTWMSPRCAVSSTVCRTRSPASPPGAGIFHRPQRVKAAQEEGPESGGALALALIYGERVLLLSPKIIYNGLTELLL